MTLNGLPSALRHETVWLDTHKYQDAERQYYERQAQEKLSPKKLHNGLTGNECKREKGKPISSIATEIANAREKIKNMLSGDSNVDINSVQFSERLQVMEEQSKKMNTKIEEMCSKLQHVESIMEDIVQRMKVKEAVITKLAETSIEINHKETADDDDDDVDLFGSDEETEEDIRIREERLKAYESKKSKKPALAAKSSVVLDVKPWDDEVDMKQLEAAVRKIEVDGLKWGASKLVPVAYGVQKLQIIAIVEDEKVSIELLQESIEENEDYVQSVDIAAFNKL